MRFFCTYIKLLPIPGWALARKGHLIELGWGALVYSDTGGKALRC
jgi:hypothetical protein